MQHTVAAAFFQEVLFQPKGADPVEMGRKCAQIPQKDWQIGSNWASLEGIHSPRKTSARTLRLVASQKFARVPCCSKQKVYGEGRNWLHSYTRINKLDKIGSSQECIFVYSLQKCLCNPYPLLINAHPPSP